MSCKKQGSKAVSNLHKENPEAAAFGVGKTSQLFSSLRGFRSSWLKTDVAAALTLAAIAVPEQLATAKLIGFPAVFGFLAFAAGTLAFAIFGTSRYVSVGADSTIAPIVVGGLASYAAVGSPRYLVLTAALAVVVGVVLLISRALRLGWFADLLSVPVTTGILAGIAVHILADQLPAMLDLAPLSGSVADRLTSLAHALPAANLYSSVIAAAVVVAGVVSERIDKRFPGPLVAVVVGTLAVWLFHLQAHGVQTLGSLRWQFPSEGIAFPSLSIVLHLLGLSMIVALLCMMQTATVLQSYPSAPSWRTDAGREFAAVGIGNLLAGLCGAFPVNASPPRTAVLDEAGARSQMAALLAVVLILVVAGVLGGVFAFVPKAALGGMLAFIAIRMIRLQLMLRIYRHSSPEILSVAASATFVIFLPIEEGVALSIVLSVAQSIYSMSRPPCEELARVPGTTVWWGLSHGEEGEKEPGILVYSLGGPLNFINANYMIGRLMRTIGSQRPRCDLVIIEATGVIGIDFTGAETLKETIAALRDQHIAVHLARLESSKARSAASRLGLFDALGSDCIFRSVEDAVRAFKDRRTTSETTRGPEPSSAPA